MAKENNQEHPQKPQPQPQQNEKITINRSHDKDSRPVSYSERFRKGNAGDSTNSTGPRKK
jgi:hypothetical protein